MQSGVSSAEYLQNMTLTAVLYLGSASLLLRSASLFLRLKHAMKEGQF